MADSAEELRREKEQLDGLFELSPDAVILTDDDFHVLRVNKEFARIFGYTAEEAAGQGLADLIVPKELHAEHLKYRASLLSGKRIEFEAIRQRKVGGLEIAMDDKALVRVLHRRTYLQKENQTGGSSKFVKVTIVIDRPAFDQLHHKVWQTFLRSSSFQQPGNVGMIEVGEELAFLLKPRDDESRILAGAYELDRDLLAVLVVRAEGTVDFAHAADANFFHNLISANAATDPCTCGC